MQTLSGKRHTENFEGSAWRKIRLRSNFTQVVRHSLELKGKSRVIEIILKAERGFFGEMVIIEKTDSFI